MNARSVRFDVTGDESMAREFVRGETFQTLALGERQREGAFVITRRRRTGERAWTIWARPIPADEGRP